MAKLPWQKTLAEITKYDWLTAVNHNRRHQKRPRDLRIAIAVMQLADANTMLAWPTQETLTELSGVADPRQVRAALSSLAGTGAIEIVRVADLSDNTRAAMAAKRNRRGKAYRLKPLWAYETFEACRSPINARAEPEKLVAGKLRKRTGSVLSKRTESVRLTADCVSPAYTKKDTKDTIQGFEGIKGLASIREDVTAYALASGDDPGTPFPVPEDEQQLEQMLAALVDGVNFSPATIVYFRRRLQDGQLTRAEVEDGRRAVS